MSLKRYLLLSATLLGIVSFPAVASTPSWSFEHPKVKSGEFTIRSACMMPAEGKLSKLGMKGKEGMSKESDEWSTSLQTLVETHLKSSEVNLLPAMSPEASGASDDELRQIVLQVEEKYQSIAAKLNRRPTDIETSRFTLGDEVSLLPCAAKSDVLVFVEGEGQVLTGGKKAMKMLVGGGKSPGATLILTMADAKTGEILAFARLSNTESFGEKFIGDTEKVYGKALDRQFSRLKIGARNRRKKH